MKRNKIDERLSELKAQKRKGLMAHTVVGYPNLKTTSALVKAMEKSGVDFVELQIPFSDPLADGPTIQRACELALENGTRVQDAFQVAATLSKETNLPLLFMTYYNIVYKYGAERFCIDAANAGISGLIVPDVPLEAAEHEGFLKSCQAHGLYNIPTFAPTSTPSRLKANAPASEGFVYCMSRQGITGAKQGFDPELRTYLNRVRQYIKLPLAVGFGISSPERLRMVLPDADIAVVGSAVVDIIASAKPQEAIPKVTQFIDSLVKEIRQKDQV